MFGFNPVPKPARVSKKEQEKVEWARKYHSVERVMFVNRMPCVVCGVEGITANCHVGNGGMGRKSDYTQIVPMCTTYLERVGCHEQSHGGIESFVRKNNLDLDALCEEVERAWLAHCNVVAK